MFFHPTSSFKAYLIAQRTAESDYVTTENFKTIDGAQCSCPKCKSTNLTENVTSMMDYTVMEYEIVCKDCLAKVAFWAHGSFEPNQPPEESSLYF